MKLLWVVVILLYPDKIEGNQNLQVFGGVPAGDGEAPYVVSIQTTNGQHVCGGSIISSSYVLTAASCFQNGIQYRVLFDSLDIFKGKLRNVDKVFSVIEHGFALAQVINAFFDITKATLADSDLPVGKNAMLFGWGSNNGVTNMLQKTNMAVGSTINLRNDQFNAGGVGQGMYPKDVGGPLVCNQIVIGVAFQSRNNPTEYPDIYINVAIIRNLIREEIGV